MKILAFAGSNSSTSINKKLVVHTLSYFEEEKVTLLDLNDFEMPLFSVDRERNDGYPHKAHQLLELIATCDLMIVSLAEHNNSYTTAFKNVMDWCSRINGKFFQHKPMLLMSTSPGGFGGGNVMNSAKAYFPKCSANILDTFSLPSFHQNFEESEGIVHPEIKADFIVKIRALKEGLKK